MIKSLKRAVDTKKRPIFTIALIAGDMVILDAIHRAGLMEKIQIIFIDTSVPPPTGTPPTTHACAHALSSLV